MKLYVLFLSFVLAVIVPINAYAIFPLALGASTAGRIVLTKAGGYAIKKLAPNALKNLITNAGKLCAGTNVRLAICSGGITLGLQKMMEENNIQVTNEGDNISIYIGDDCIRYRYDAATHQFGDTTNYRTAMLACNSVVGKTYVNGTGWNAGKFLYGEGVVSGNHCENDVIYTSPDGTQKIKLGGTIYAIQDNTCTATKKYLSDDDIYNNIVNNLSDDDIQNIYNYDYSQHNNLTINGDKFDGDKVNGNKINFDEGDTKNITNNLGDKIINKKYDADDVNDTNCDKNAQGEYDKCGDDRDTDDDTPDSSTPPTDTPKDPDSDDDTPEQPDDEPPIECTSNAFNQKICEWMDWTQANYDKPTDTKPDITDKTKDLPQLKQDRVSFGEQCPPSKKITISAMGVTKYVEISYQQYCDFFTAFKPFAVPLSTFGAILIIAGVGRKDG